MLLEKEESVSVKQLEEEYMESESLPADPSFHFNLGVSLWEKGEESQDIRGKAVEHFMMAVKLNPQNGDAFRYLGHYYAHDSPMPLRALKCYQRAVFLNPDDSCAGEAICDMLDKEGKESLVFAVCCEASEKSARAFWAFRQLGYLQAHQKKWSEAVHNLQHAIRGFPTCADLWEVLPRFHLSNSSSFTGCSHLSLRFRSLIYLKFVDLRSCLPSNGHVNCCSQGDVQ